MTSIHPRRENSQRPGQMTAAMRASVSVFALTHGPKVLRIGVVQDGRVRDERTIKSPVHVSVGTNEENTFLLAGNAQPPSFRLFERIDDAYHLNFTQGMQGRVVLASGLFDLNQLRTRAERSASGSYRVALSEDSRGRVVLGGVTFLFHFVEPPPVQPKAVLPAAVLRGQQHVDWNSTICAALSFLLHFMILGAVYSDWADPVIDDDVSTAGLIDSLKSLPPPPPVEDKTFDDEPPATPTHEEPPARTKATPAPAKNSSGPAPDGPRPEQVSQIATQLDQIDVAILGALRNDRPATAGVLKPGEVPSTALDEAAASKAGVGFDNGPRLASAGAPIRPGTPPDLRDIGNGKRGPDVQGTVATVKGPKGVANVAAPSTIGGVVSNAARVVAGMRARFHACYQHGLNENPEAAGSIKLTIRVGPGGEVLGVMASPSGNLPPSVVSCVQARAQAAQFDPPEGGSAVISVPVTFVKQ